MNKINIQVTKDYSKFKIVNGNREINKAHVKRLAKSISDNNLLEFNPILVNKNYEVIDGQHRLTVAQENNLPVYFVMVNPAGLAEVQLLNANSKAWSMSDYLKSYIKLGINDYSILEDYMDQYGLPLMISAAFLEGIELNSQKFKNLPQKFRAGEFRVKSLNKAIQLAEKIVIFKPYVEKGAWRGRYFIEALTTAFGIVRAEKLLKKVKTSKKLIIPQVNRTAYLRALEDILNYRSRSETRLY